MSRRRPKSEKPTKPLAQRKQSERYEADRILHGRRGNLPVYDRNIHPDGILAYFKKALDSMRETERFQTEHRLQHVQAPVRPPTIAGYAARTGITRECVWSWGKKHVEFGEALDKCKAIQEDVFLVMGATGAYNAGVLALMMKNLQGWQDRVEQTHKGEVTLHFDAQDSEA